MDFNQFTIKAQEVMQQAVKIANANNQQAVETGHILEALFEKFGFFKNGDFYTLYISKLFSAGFSGCDGCNCCKDK